MLVKNPQNATATFSISKSAEESTYIMKQVIDPQNSYPFKTKKCVDLINNWIKSNNINFISPTATTEEKKNTFDYKADEALRNVINNIVSFDLKPLQSEREVQAGAYLNTFQFLWDEITKERRKRKKLFVDEFHFLTLHKASARQPHLRRYE